jgi:hypothetical protein
MPSNVPPPKPKPKNTKPKRKVWVACRATHGCEGQQCEVAWEKKSPGGGRNIRYKCLTCGGAFHTNT